MDLNLRIRRLVEIENREKQVIGYSNLYSRRGESMSEEEVENI